MIRGVNNCEIEENVITGIPDFFYPLSNQNPSDIQGLVWAESTKSRKERKDINTFMGEAGGGIDPETGYTRRVMTTFSWIDFTRPVPLDDLPDYTNWVAGVDASIHNRTLYQSSVYDKKKDLEYSNQSIYTIIILLSILVWILIIIGIIYLVNSKNQRLK